MGVSRSDYHLKRRVMTDLPHSSHSSHRSHRSLRSDLSGLAVYPGGVQEASGWCSRQRWSCDRSGLSDQQGPSLWGSSSTWRSPGWPGMKTRLQNPTPVSHPTTTPETVMVCPGCRRNIAPRLHFCCSLKRAGSWEELWIQGRGMATLRETLMRKSCFLSIGTFFFTTSPSSGLFPFLNRLTLNVDLVDIRLFHANVIPDLTEE